MKKILSLALAALFLLCSAAMAEEPVWASVTSDAKYDEPITLTSARVLDPTFEIDESDPDKKSYTENRWMSVFRDVLNINVEYAWLSPDGDSDNAKWGAAIASGSLPDFATVSNSVYKQLLESDLCYDCTDLWANDISDVYKNLVTDDLLSSLTYDGKLLGLPIPSNGYIGNALLFVRSDWLKKLNLEVPKTIDEVIEVARAFKEAKLGGEDTIGMLFAAGDGVNDGRLEGYMNGFDAYRNIWVEKDGKLVWSNTLPEMRDALLSLQSLYAEGLINQDFAVTNGTVAQEYVASGKVGVFYSTDYATTMSMQAMHDLDPEADVVVVGIPGLTEDAQTKVQTGAIQCPKLFINKNCEHPEAVAAMLNLEAELIRTGNSENFTNYSSSNEGYLWYKQLPWGSHLPSTKNDIVQANEVREWQQTGVRRDDYEMFGTYSVIDKLSNGLGAWWYPYTFGEGASYTYDYDMYMAGRMIPDAFNGLPTPTMDALGEIVNDTLNTAMLEVIMGADISTYDAAVENWFANGGQAITDEVNDWYESI